MGNYSAERDTEYYDILLFNYLDKQATGNSLKISSYIVITAYGTTEQRLKFKISNYQNKINFNVNLAYQYVFSLLQRIKGLQDKLPEILESIKSDINKSHIERIYIAEDDKTFSMEFKFDSRFKGPCITLSITDSSKTYLSDNEIIYMDIKSFMSMIQLIVGYRDTYITTSYNFLNFINSKKIVNNLEIINQKLNDLSKKISEYTPVGNHEVSHPGIEDVPQQPQREYVQPTDEQTEFDVFVDNNVDSFTVDMNTQYLDKQNKKLEDVEQQTVEKDYSFKEKDFIFTDEICKGNICNLETLLYAANTSDAPFNTIVNTINNDVRSYTGNNEFNIISDCPNEDFLALIYVTTIMIKKDILVSIKNNAPITQSVINTYYRTNGQHESERYNVACECLMYLLYLSASDKVLRDTTTQIETDKNNYHVFAYLYKYLFGPIALSILKNTQYTRTIIESGLKKYYDYAMENGVFNKLSDDMRKLGINTPEISWLQIQTNFNNVYQVLSTHDKLYIGNVLENNLRAKNVVPYNIELMRQNGIDSVDKVIFAIKNPSSQQPDANNVVATEVKNTTPPVIANNNNMTLETAATVEAVQQVSHIGAVITRKMAPSKPSNLAQVVDEIVKSGAYDNNTIAEINRLLSFIKNDIYDLHGVEFDYSTIPVEVLNAVCNWDFCLFTEQIKISMAEYRRLLDANKYSKEQCLAILNDIYGRGVKPEFDAIPNYVKHFQAE